MKNILILLFFISITTCSNPQNKKINNNTANNKNNDTSNVTVLCRCKEGYTSWSGPDQASAEETVKKNCESIGGSVSDCKVIN